MKSKYLRDPERSSGTTDNGFWMKIPSTAAVDGDSDMIGIAEHSDLMFKSASSGRFSKSRRARIRGTTHTLGRLYPELHGRRCTTERCRH